MENNALASKNPGIFYGYWIVAVTFFCSFIFSGCGFYAFSLFTTPLINEFGWGRGGIMGALTIFFMIGGLSSPAVGRLVDRYDIKKIVATGAFVTGLGFVFLSLVNTLWHFYAAYIVAGIGMAGIGMVPATTLISNWFVKRRGTAVGIMSSGIGAGGFIIAPLIGGYMIPNFGWRTSYLSIALFCWAIIPFALLVLKSKPEDMGLYPDGVQANEVAAKDEALVAASQGLSLKMALATPIFWLICVSFLAHGIAESGTLQTHVPYMEGIGFSLAAASLLFGAVGLSSTIGKFLFGWLCDQIQAKYACAIGLGFQLAGVLILISLHQSSSVLLLWLYAIVIGLGVGSWLPAMSMLVSSNFGLSEYGSIFGLVNVNMAVGASIGPLVAGAVFDATGGYHWAFIIFIIAYTVAIPTVLLTRRPQSP